MSEKTQGERLAADVAAGMAKLTAAELVKTAPRKTISNLDRETPNMRAKRKAAVTSLNTFKDLALDGGG
jgi:hypothetical protein